MSNRAYFFWQCVFPFLIGFVLFPLTIMWFYHMGWLT